MDQKWSLKRISLVVLTFLTVLFLFQNCSSGFTSSSITSASTSSGTSNEMWFGATLPTLPQQFSTTSSPPLPANTNRGSYYTPGYGHDSSMTLQQALNDAASATGNLGDVIVLQAGTTYTTSSSFTLPTRSGSGWIYIISSDAPEIGGSGLPTAGMRVSPSDVSDMASIRSTSTGGGPIIKRGISASYYRLVGLDIELTDANAKMNSENFYDINFNNKDISPSTLASNITIDRCYITGSPTYGVRHAVDMDGNFMEVVGSYITAFDPATGDNNAILVINSLGPYKIHNNYLQAGGETTLFGGSDTTLPFPSEPSDITITNNDYYKPYFVGTGSVVNGSSILTINSVTNGFIQPTMAPKDANSYIPARVKIISQLSGTPGGAGTYQMSSAAIGTTAGSVNVTAISTGKNMVEFKTGQRVLFSSNYLTNAGAPGQPRSAFVLTSRDQAGTNPWYHLADFTISDNVFTNAMFGGFNVLMQDNASMGAHDTQPAERILFRNNIFIQTVSDGTTSTAISLIGSNLAGVDEHGGGNGGDLIFDHNSFIDTASSGAPETIWFGAGTVNMALNNCVWSNNIFDSTQYGIGAGPTLSHFANAIPPQCTHSVFVNNVLVGNKDSTVPAGNFKPVNDSAVGFTNYGSATSDTGYALSPLSLYHGIGVSGLGLPYSSSGTLDGTDIGVNILELPTN